MAASSPSTASCVKRPSSRNAPWTWGTTRIEGVLDRLRGARLEDGAAAQQPSQVGRGIDLARDRFC